LYTHDIKEERYERYIEDVNRVKEKYGHRIDILLGVEYDMMSMIDTTPFDYVIGGAHILDHNGDIILVDSSQQKLEDKVNEHFDGDYYKLCELYYSQLSRVITYTDCDIVAHFDLVTKYNEGGVLFNEEDKRYRDAAFDCLDTLIKKDPVFEINTGAISRGYRTSPYPSMPILKRMAELGARMTITTDCHNAEFLLCYYDEAIDYAAECGLSELWYPKNGQFVPYKI
jgi:histidinol-phosphatase (PHP family)